MMTPEFIIDVDETNFEYEVLSYSQNIPVVVDFWATWCNPCKMLTPMLEKLVTEANGNIRLARIDVDANPNLALRYSVRSIPTVKMFSQGQVASEFVGLQPEPRIREFFSKILPPSPTSLALEKAESLLNAHQWIASERMFRELLEQTSDQPASYLGLTKALIAQGKADEALGIIQNFPASRQYNQALILLPLAKVIVEQKNNKMAGENDLDAMFQNSIRLAARGNLPAALDGLLDILRQNKHYNDGQAHKITLSLLELMGDSDPQTRQYRSELASILF
jgi:putative thioredoxin